MRLLYVFPEPLPLERARGLQVASTVAALGRLGVQVDLVHVPVNGRDPLAHYGIEAPATVRRVPLSRSLPWPLGRVHSNRIFHARLRHALGAALKLDALVVRHLKLAHLLLGSGNPLLYEAHEVFADTAAPGKKAAIAALEREVMARADCIVTNSGQTARRLAALYGRTEKVTVIPNGVDRPSSLPEKRWEQAAQHLIYAGSLFAWKGVQELVEAAAQLPGHCLTLIGGSPEGVARLRAQASPEGARIDFPGMLPHPEVMKRLAGACIAILPNRPDTDSDFTSPIKLFEYMAAGCAIVASDLPALREILEDDDAVWFAPGDARSLAEAIARLAGNPALACRLGERARNKSAAYTWDARARRLLDAIVAARRSIPDRHDA